MEPPFIIHHRQNVHSLPITGSLFSVMLPTPSIICLMRHLKADRLISGDAHMRPTTVEGYLHVPCGHVWRGGRRERKLKDLSAIDRRTMTILTGPPLIRMSGCRSENVCFAHDSKFTLDGGWGVSANGHAHDGRRDSIIGTPLEMVG